jgi:acetyltransferase-like isoleucine patch superfamily enzyme
MDRSNLPANVSVAADVKLGENVRIAPFVNLYGCEIGDDTRLGTFVEVQKQASIGKRCKISSHTFVCSGVVIEDGVFIGHGVVFINDRLPREVNGDGSLQTESDWRLEETRIREGASIGSGAIIMCGVTVGERAMVGAGTLVTHDVPPYVVIESHPARVRRLMLAENGALEKRGSQNAD